MESLTLTIPWKPHAKQRPRSGRNGVTYTPKATRDAEALIAANWHLLTNHAPFEGPIAVALNLGDADFTIDIWENEPCLSRKLRGDVDNYAKTILDALNRVAWIDDKQIRDLRVVKR